MDSIRRNKRTMNNQIHVLTVKYLEREIQQARKWLIMWTEIFLEIPKRL